MVLCIIHKGRTDMETFRPMFFSDMKNYSGKQFVSDLISGVIVAVIALPLSIALAIASGVAPEAGIYTAIVAGFFVALFGGSNVQIAGPTAAFATIVAGIVAKNGTEGLMLATIMAGIMLIIMGFCKLGDLIRFIPFTITTGFTSGIAITLVIGQLKDFLGISYQNGESPIDTIDKAKALVANASTFNADALIIGAVSLAIIFIWPKIFDKIPASLLAIIASVVLVKAFDMDVNTIGDLYTISGKLPSVHIPSVTLRQITDLIPDAFTIAMLAGIESLLSCVVADGMINKRHRSNTELVAQGIANVGSAVFGGIPATGAIARTAANIKNGGRTPVSAMVHSIVLVVVLVVLMPYASLIPMTTIAAILIGVAYNMCQWRTFLTILKTSPKSDIIVLVVTCLLTVVFDLVEAIEVGVVATSLLFVKRMSEETTVKTWIYSYKDTEEHIRDLMEVPKEIRVFELNGPMFFAVSNIISTLTTRDYTKVVILRMRSVPMIDTDALRKMEKFVSECRAQNITVVFSHVNEQPLKAMKKEGLYEHAGPDNFCVNIDAAMLRAKELCNITE